MKALEIARVSILRTFRDRMGLFFIVILPMILVIVLGMTYGGMNVARVGVADQDGSAMSASLVDDLQTTDVRLEIRHYATAAEVRDAVERGFVEIGLAVPAGYDAALRGGGQAQVEMVAQPRITPARSVRRSRRRGSPDLAGPGGPLRQHDDRRHVRRRTRGAAPQRAIARRPSPASRFASRRSATSPPIRTGSRWGGEPGHPVHVPDQHDRRRCRDHHPPARDHPPGVLHADQRAEHHRRRDDREVRFALFQGGFIVVASAVLFGVDWIDPWASGAIVITFALVASGAAMLLATLVTNEHQLSAVGPALGMILGLLGGTMVPMEVFPDTIRTLSHVTPHAWAMDAFHRLLLGGGGLADVLVEVGVLLGFAVVLLTLAVFRFRRAITA